MMARLEAAYDIVEIARRKEAEGDLRRAHMPYESAITDFMHLSFAECRHVSEVKAWLSAHPFEGAANRFFAITEDILRKPETEWGRFFQSGNYLLVAFSHLFSALGQDDRARYSAQAAVQLVMFSTPFWGEYAKTHWALMRGRSYEPVFGKLKGVERLWATYVDLMRAAMRRDGMDAALEEVDRQFKARNSDMNLQEDAYMIDGTGEFPVKFEFRKAGVLAVIDNVKLRSVS